ncbi:MAG: AraD1 family protein [Brevundimonas sp.]|uniref:AraD1 family protein n=1 Tax=Brevundimonas sp. TaxID=1871086 RepID=UPI00391DBB1F
MPLRLLQLDDPAGNRLLAVMTDDGRARRVDGHVSTYDLALSAIAAGSSLGEAIQAAGMAEAVDVHAALAGGRVRAPIDHPDPAHLLVTGTGLTHLGSAEGRDKMHRDLNDASALTDSMKMFKLGLEGGKPGPGQTGVQPEWFYKGDGGVISAPGAPLTSPAFALDGGEEPELAGIYVIGPDGTPFRLGFALGNEFSDHVTERQNYLYLAHSKLRACSLGAEILLGEPPADVRGTVRIHRDDAVLWEKPFLSGEANMCHSIANLEHHHFKYAQFRRPGDVHVHFMGTATLSFSDGIETRPGDVFEVEAAPFLTPVRNPLAVEAHAPVTVRTL